MMNFLGDSILGQNLRFVSIRHSLTHSLPDVILGPRSYDGLYNPVSWWTLPRHYPSINYTQTTNDPIDHVNLFPQVQLQSSDDLPPPPARIGQKRCALQQQHVGTMIHIEFYFFWQAERATFVFYYTVFSRGNSTIIFMNWPHSMEKGEWELGSTRWWWRTTPT